MLDIHNLMADLSQHRPIFHSEADFQFALAWRIHEVMSDCEIRLELPYRKEKNWHLDIYLPPQRIVIELKYLQKALELKHNGEHFSLSDHNGQLQKRYDFLKDIQRLERVVSDGKAKSGFAVLLTNDSGYWKPSSKADAKDADFHLHEGRTVKGELTWAEDTKPGTKKGREQPIHLKSSYHLHWKDYYNFEKENDRQFQDRAVGKKKTAPKLRGLGLREKSTNHLFQYLTVSVK